MQLVRICDRLQRSFFTELWPRAFNGRPAGKLTPRQIGHVMAIRHVVPCNINEIMARTQLSSAAASLLIDKLEKVGVLRRRTHNGDKRNIIVEFTEEFQSEIDAANEFYMDFFREVTRDFGESDRRIIEYSSELLCQAMESVSLERTEAWQRFLERHQ